MDDMRAIQEMVTIPKGLDIPEAYKIPVYDTLSYAENIEATLGNRIRELEAENKRLRAQIAALEDTSS